MDCCSQLLIGLVCKICFSVFAVYMLLLLFRVHMLPITWRIKMNIYIPDRDKVRILCVVPLLIFQRHQMLRDGARGNLDERGMDNDPRGEGAGIPDW